MCYLLFVENFYFTISNQVWLESADDNWEMDGIVMTCAGLEILSWYLISADSSDSKTFKKSISLNKQQLASFGDQYQVYFLLVQWYGFFYLV